MRLLDVIMLFLLLQVTSAAKIKDTKVKTLVTSQAKNHQQSADLFQYDPKKIQNVKDEGNFKVNEDYHSNTLARSNAPAPIQQYVDHSKEGQDLRTNGPKRNNQDSTSPLRNHHEVNPSQNYRPAPVSRTYHEEPAPVQQKNQIHQQSYLGIPNQRKPQQHYSKANQGSKDVIQSRHDNFGPDYDFHDHDYDHHHHDDNRNEEKYQSYRPNHQKSRNRFSNDNFERYNNGPKVKTFFRGPSEPDFGSINRPSASESSTNPHRGSGSRHANSGGHGDYQEPQKGCKFVEKEVKNLPEDKNNNGKSFTSKRYMMVKECFYDNDQSFGNDQKPKKNSKNDHRGSESQNHGDPFEYSFNDDDFFKDYFQDDEEDKKFHREFSEDHFQVRPYRY